MRNTSKATSIRFAHGSDGGFTLVEMSLVLIVIGAVIGTVFPALQAVRQGAQESMTAGNLAVLLRATAAFVHANGCLPCPAPAGTYGNGFGRVRGEATGTACGTCALSEGIPPFASLGLAAAMAKDGFGRWITMRIDPYLATNFGIVPVTGSTGFCQKDLSKQSGAVPIDILTPGSATPQKAAVLFLSHGANGYGSFRAGSVNVGQTNAHPAYKGPATACSATAGFERCNVNNDASFTNAPRTNDDAAPFDDTLAYMDRNALVASIGSGVCQTEW